VIRRVDLNGRADLRPGPDGDGDDIQDHAVEVEEYVAA
jgi:hypothetical protein